MFTFILTAIYIIIIVIIIITIIMSIQFPRNALYEAVSTPIYEFNIPNVKYGYIKQF